MCNSLPLSPVCTLRFFSYWKKKLVLLQYVARHGAGIEQEEALKTKDES